MSAQRFRPNIVLDGDELEEPEGLHLGTVLRLGNVTIEITGPTYRCAFVALEQAGIGRSPEAIRIIKQKYGMYFGLYANVVQEDQISAANG